MDHRSYGPVVRFRFRLGAWNNAALVDFARYALRTEVISSPVGLVPTTPCGKLRVNEYSASNCMKKGRNPASGLWIMKWLRGPATPRKRHSFDPPLSI